MKTQVQPSPAQPYAACLLIRETRLCPDIYAPNKELKIHATELLEFIMHSPAPESAFFRCEARQEEERHGPRK